MRLPYLSGNRQDSPAGRISVPCPNGFTRAEGIPMNDLIERYIASWNETDPALRRTLLDGLWAESASYIDPLAEASGRDQIDAVIAAAQAQFPGLRFTLIGPVDAHHRQ